MEIVDKRKVDAEGEARETFPVEQFDDFRPTLAGFMPLFDAVLLRELKLPEESAIVTPDAFSEPCLYCEVIAIGSEVKNVQTKNSMINIKGNEYMPKGISDVVRILKGIGTTIAFSDTDPGQRYFTVHVQDIIGKWSRQ
jgi:hypothetical protein